MSDYRRGDVGLVRLRGTDYGAICTDGAGPTGHWAVKARSGVMVLLVPQVLAAWRATPRPSLDVDAALRLMLARLSQSPFVYGELDCALAVAEWIRDLTGRDPAADLRGAYDDEAGWRRLAREAGGLEALFAAVAARAGLDVVSGAVSGGGR